MPPRRWRAWSTTRGVPRGTRVGRAAPRFQSRRRSTLGWLQRSWLSSCRVKSASATPRVGPCRAASGLRVRRLRVSRVCQSDAITTQWCASAVRYALVRGGGRTRGRADRRRVFPVSVLSLYPGVSEREREGDTSGSLLFYRPGAGRLGARPSSVQPATEHGDCWDTCPRRPDVIFVTVALACSPHFRRALHKTFPTPPISPVEAHRIRNPLLVP